MAYRDVVAAEGVVLEIQISSTYYPIGCADAMSYEVEKEIIYKTDVNAGNHRKKRARRTDSRITCSGITKISNANNVVGWFELLDMCNAGSEQTFRMTWTAQDLTTATVTATGIISRMTSSGSASDWSDFDLEIEVSGDIDQTNPADPGSGSQIDSDTWTISGGNAYIEDSRLRNIAAIIEVCHEGIQLTETSGTPSGREYKYSVSGSNGRITIDSNLAINGQTIFVIWLY